MEHLKSSQPQQELLLCLDLGKVFKLRLYMALSPLEIPQRLPRLPHLLNYKPLLKVEQRAERWEQTITYNDLSLISDMEDTLLAMETPEQTPRRHAMEATGIIGEGSWHMENGKPRAMVNFTKLAMLHHGALIQVGDRFAAMETLHAAEIAELKGQMNLLMEKN